MKNIEVIDCFLKGIALRGNNIWTTGEKLYSYNTCIAEKAVIDGCSVMLINLTRFSTTTSRHRNTLIRRVFGSTIVRKYVTGVPKGATNLIKYKDNERIFGEEGIVR